MVVKAQMKMTHVFIEQKVLSFSSVLGIKKSIRSCSPSLAFSGIILKEYDWSPSSMTFSEGTD